MEPCHGPFFLKLGPWLQPPCDPTAGLSGSRKWMDGCFIELRSGVFAGRVIKLISQLHGLRKEPTCASTVEVMAAISSGPSSAPYHQ